MPDGRDGRERLLGSCVRWSAVAGGHLLILLLLGRSAHPPPQIDSQSRTNGVLLLVPVSLPVEPPAKTGMVPEKVPQTPAVEPPKVDTPAATPSESPIRAPIDWHRQARDAARATAGDSAPARPRVFGEPVVSPYRKCGKKPEFEWNPEQKRAGFAGGLPYVRLGKRCVVGLGFFGCAVGELPRPNSQLFTEMGKPDQPTSSVPDDEECAPQ